MEIEKILKLYQRLKQEKDKWNNIYQDIGEFVDLNNQSFMSQGIDQKGERTNNNVYDSTAPKASGKASSMLMGMLWQGGGKSLRIEPKNLPNNKEIKDYFEALTKAVSEAFDDPEAGFLNALEEYFQAQLNFGTSGLGAFEGEESDLLFKSYHVANILIQQGKNGKVKSVFEELEYTPDELADEYGEENLPEKIREKLKNFDQDMIKVVVYTFPRTNRNPEMKDNKNMPYGSIHFLEKEKHKLKESGYQEQPIFITRFKKRAREVYGRSPAMDALPDVLRINAVEEIKILALEKILDPPIAVEHDSVVGNGEIDTSAGGVVVIKPTGKLSNPIQPINDVGDISSAQMDIEQLKDSINDHFLIDKLLDFNNETQMTARETTLRNQIRNQSLGSIFTRQIYEGLNPMVDRSINILWSKGKLGVIKGTPQHNIMLAEGKSEILIVPDKVREAIEEGNDFYEIKYFTPAARAIESEEIAGIHTTLEFAMGFAQAAPEIMDYLEPDEALKKVARSSGAPTQIIKDDKTVKETREARRKAQQAENQKIEASQDLDLAGQAAQIDQTMKGA